MKKSIVTIYGCVLLFSGCKEIWPPVVLSNNSYTDTAYTVSTIPVADPHNVLVEDFTGQSCPQCPPARAELESLSPASQLNILELFFYGPPQTEKPNGAANDFRTQDATDIDKYMYDDATGNGIPCAGIDRVPVGGALIQYLSAWSSIFSSRVSIVDSVNLSATSSLNTSDSIATIIVTITYLQNVSTAQNLSLAVVEDSIIDFQEVSSGIDSFYVFNDVFRTLISSDPYGDPILPGSTLKRAGTVDRRTYLYKVQPGWNLAHCRLVAFVHYSNSEPIENVFQSTQCTLTGY